MGLVLGALLFAENICAQGAFPSAVSSQANTDAEAQRRLQETARQAQRQRRIDEMLRLVSPALYPEKLSGPEGPVLIRKALAALIRLQAEGVSLDESVTRAIRTSGIDSTQTAKPASYLRNLFVEKSGQVTPNILARLEAGEDPAPDLFLFPYAP